jgi:hypothetical protein
MKYLCLLGWCAAIALVRLFPSGSLLGLLGFLSFWGFSLALIFFYLRFAVRSLKASHRFRGLALIGGAVLLAGFLASLHPFSRGDKTEIERTIEAVATGSGPAYCDSLVTQRYLVQATGAKPPFADEVCESDAEDTSRAHSVDASEIAIEGARATAAVEYGGGSFDGSQLVVQLVKDGGKWKLDRIVAFRTFDRPRFDRAYRRSFLEFGSPVASADCALAKARRLSNAEIERAALRDLPRIFMPFFVACDRSGAERTLVKSIAAPKLDLPAASIECAAAKAKAFTDPELGHLLLSPLAYSELLYRCGPKAFYGFFERELPVGEKLDPPAVECVLDALHARSVPAAIRLSYDQTRFQAVIDRCR